MKIASRVKFPIAKKPDVSRAKVCMHLLVPACTNYRVMNDAAALVAAGFDVSILDVVADRTLPCEEEICGVHLKHIIQPDWFIATRFKPWFLVKALFMAMGCTLHLLCIDADIYHAHVEVALPATYLAAKLRRKRLILDTPELTMSGPNITRWPLLRTLAIRVLRAIVPSCAGYITGSPYYAQEICNLYHAARVTVIRHVPPYRFVTKNNRLHQRLNLPSHIRIALYQGYLQPDRGLDKLVCAATYLPSDIVIVMMGNGYGTTEAELKALIASEGVADRVKIIPAVPYEELLDWTASADIGLTILPPDYSTSIRKCLPNKFFEYLMAGLPVLSSELDAIVEMIKTYDVGRVVTSLAPADIAHAITAMLNDHVALDRMRRNALEIAHRDFYWEKESQKLVDLYQELLEN